MDKESSTHEEEAVCIRDFSWESENKIDHSA
jgi:hypothetical protein